MTLFTSNYVTLLGNQVFVIKSDFQEPIGSFKIVLLKIVNLLKKWSEWKRNSG